MEFCLLTEKEFSDFVNSRPEKNFFQTVMMKKRLEKEKHDVYLVGVKKDGKVIAASLIANTLYKFMGQSAYEAYKGFILDYNDYDLLKYMTYNVKKFLKSKNVFRLIIDPYIPNVSRDTDANIVDGIDNRKIKFDLHSLGYEDNPNGAQVKWTYCLDINGRTSQEILNDMRSSTRNYINRTLTKYKLKVRTLKKEELKDFKKITSNTCDRREFNDKSLEYYENMYDCFKDDVKFMICELDCNEYLKVLEEENANYKDKINELSDSSSNLKKKETMKKEINNNLNKIEELKNLRKEKGNIVPLSAAMFILYGDEIVYLFSGSYAEYMNYCGQYRLQWEIIKYAADNKYRRYNFYGIQDVFNPKGKDYGVYEFKKGFNGYVEELLGSFYLDISLAGKFNSILKLIKRLTRIRR